MKLLRMPFYLLGLIPYSWMQFAFGKLMYFKLKVVFKYRQDVIIQNLSRSFPDKKYHEIKTISKDFYKYFSHFFVDVIYLFSGRKAWSKSKVNFTNLSALDPYIQQNRQIICLLGHFGNWEYLNIMPQYMPCRVNAVYKPLSNQFINRFMLEVRGQHGLHLIPDKQILRTLLKNKEVPQFTFFIADQFPGRNNGVPVEFLNQPTTMFCGAEKIAKALDAVVCYLDMNRCNEHIWHMQVKVLTEHASQTESGEITKGFAESLEKSIVNNPSIWLWSHKRWK